MEFIKIVVFLFNIKIMTLSAEVRLSTVEKYIRANYEKGNQSRCLQNVWRHYIFPQMGISLTTFKRYVKILKQRDKTRFE